MIDFVRLLLYKLGIVFTDFTISLLYLLSYFLLPLTKTIVTKILSDSDIHVNGNRRWDPKVADDRFYCLFAKYSYSGLIDAYQYEYFECEDLMELFTKIHRSKHYTAMCYHPSLIWRSFFTRNFFVQTDEQSIGKAYDDSIVDLVDEKCDTLSTGYWKNAKTLEESYDAKHNLIARKLKLQPGMRVLDLGCGEGALCKYLAENYDVEVIGVNVSESMVEKARRFCRGLKTTFKIMDARMITGKYDRITCIGMIEHLGVIELRKLFKTIHRCLSDDGIFLLEIYSTNQSLMHTSNGSGERLFNMVVCFHYYLDTMRANDDLLIVEDCQNLRNHSGTTMKNLIEKIDKSSQQQITNNKKLELRAMKAGYADIGALHISGQMHVYQLVLSKKGLKDGYDAVV